METLPQHIKCTICGEGFNGRPAVLCRNCGTPHHADCWQYNGGCSIFGCNCRRAEKFVPGQTQQGCRQVCLTPDVKSFTYKSTAIAFFLVLLVSYIQDAKSILFNIIFIPSVIGSLVFALGESLRFVFPTCLTAFPENGGLARQHTLFGRLAWWCKPLECNVKEVVVSHLRKGDDRNEQLHIVHEDGEKELIYDRRLAFPWQRLPWSDLCSLAEALAEATDSSVRIFNEDRLSMGVTSHGSSLPSTRNLPIDEGEKKKPKIDRLFIPETCPNCNELLSGPILQCQRCRKAVHKECWEMTNGCPVEGCGGRTADLPRPTAAPGFPISCEAPIRLRETLLYMGAIGLFLSFLSLPLPFQAGYIISSCLLLLALSASLASQTSLGTDFFTWRFTFEPKSGRIKRTFQCNGFPIYSEDNWGSIGQIIDVNHHWYCYWGTRFEEVYFIDKDGKRTLAYSQSSADEVERSGLLGSRDIEGLADKIAELCDCTVQFVRERKQPPRLPAQLKE